MEYIEFAPRARALKTEKNVTNADIARGTNISESMVSRYLNGEAVPTYDKAQDIFRFLGAYEQNSTYNPPHLTMCTSMSEVKAIYDGRIADLKNTIDILQQRNAVDRDDLKQQIAMERDERRRTLVGAIMLGVISIVLAIIVAATLYIDLSNGSTGWFRY